jgi:hypothetical protein
MNSEVVSDAGTDEEILTFDIPDAQGLGSRTIACIWAFA